MNLTEAEIAYYLATLILHDLEPQGEIKKKQQKAIRKRRP